MCRFSGGPTMAECRFARCISEKRAARRQLVAWSRSASILLGLEQVLIRIMEDNSALKIRSDLYPKYIAAIQSSHIASTQDTAAREPSQRIGGLSSVGSISGTTDTSIKNNNNNSLINKDSCRRDSDAIEVRDQYFENANLSSSRLVEHDNQTLCREATPTKVKQFAEPFRTPSERNSPNFSECASSSPPCEVAPEEGNLRRNSEGEEDNDEDEEKIDVVTPDEAVDQLIHRRIVPNVLSSSPLCPKSPIVEFSTPYNIERFYQPSRQVPPDGERGSGTSEEDKRQSFSPLSTFCPFGMIPDVEKLRKMNSLIFQESGQPPSYDPSLYAANLPPHLLPWLISSHLHSLVHYQDQKDQQPLDLSAKKSPEKELMPKVFEVKPSTRGRRRADSGKRNYSEEELNAALHDIQSGKLGTRRAAVLYGIPRSTLRNKVYKLTMERERTKKLIESSDSPASGFLHDQLASFRPNLSLTASDDSGETLKAIIRSKMTEHLEELDQNNQAYLTGVEKQRLLDSSFNHLFENIPKLALNFENKSTPSEVLSTLSLYPQLYDFTQKIVEDRFHEEIKRTKARLNGLSYPPNGFPLGGDDMPICPSSYSGLFNLSTNNNFIFKEDKQESSHSRASPPQENFKDMIAQIINNKLQGDSINDNSNTGSSDSYSSTPIRHYESFNKTDIRSPADKRIQADQGTKKRAKSPSSAAGGKGSRPKRGKYRNYDRDNLLKAVQAVQNGEMSVHRAGSFYGVPHSTLEYKVKERHLHRGKNKKDSVVSLTMPDLLKNNKDNNSPSYMESYGGKNEATEATSDLPRSASHSSNEEVAVISVRPSVPKLKPSREEDHSSSRVTMPQHPFVSNPFPFWNNSSTILAPFLPSPYQTDPLLREIQEKLNNNEDSKDGKVLTNGLTQSQSHEINFSAVSEGLLNSLLRKKIETTNSSEHENAGGCLQLGTSPIAPSGLLNLNALLPSFLTAQSSLVARATICSPHTQGPSMSAKAYAPQSAPLSLVKEAASLKLSLGGLPAAEAP